MVQWQNATGVKNERCPSDKNEGIEVLKEMRCPSIKKSGHDACPEVRRHEIFLTRWMIIAGGRIGEIIREVVIRNFTCIAEASPRADDTPEIDDVLGA